MDKEFCNEIYELVTQFQDKNLVFVVVEIDFGNEIKIEASSCTPDELAQQIIDCSNNDLGNQSLMTPSQLKEYGLILSLKKIHDQIVKGISDRAFMLTISNHDSPFAIMISDKVDQESFTDAVMSLLRELSGIEELKNNIAKTKKRLLKHQYYLVGKDCRPVNNEDQLVSARECNRLAFTKIGNVEVSTVFLCMDHGSWNSSSSPVLFETMITGGLYDEKQYLYTDYEEAEEGHQERCREVLKEIKIELIEK